MKYLQNLHTHTTFCDGKNTCRELIERAIEIGFNSIGFSGHGYTPFDIKYSMSKDNTLHYIEEVKNLKKEYSGVIDVYLGIEYDLFSDSSLAPYDYVIGSVHYAKDKEGNYFTIDIKNTEQLVKTINEKFGGNPMALAKCYFEQVATLPKVLKRVDVVGHFDLITKSNDGKKIIDTSSEEYRKYAKMAIKELIGKVGAFEINTGAVARGLKKEPYPERWILEEICKLGGKVIISSDCHLAEKLDFYFEDAVKYAKQCGFNEIAYFDGKGFKYQSI